MRKLSNNLNLEDLTKVVFETVGLKIFIEVTDVKELMGQNGKNYYLVKGINPVTREKIYFYSSSMLTDVFEKEDLINCILSITFEGERKSKTSKFGYKVFDVYELEPDEMKEIILDNKKKLKV